MSKSQYPNTRNHFDSQCHLATLFNENVKQSNNMAEIFTSRLLYFPRMNPRRYELRSAEARQFGLFKQFPDQN